MSRLSPVYPVSAKSVFWGGVAIAVAAAAQTLFYVAWWA
jgi:hypothetical protein